MTVTVHLAEYKSGHRIVTFYVKDMSSLPSVGHFVRTKHVHEESAGGNSWKDDELEYFKRINEPRYLIREIEHVFTRRLADSRAKNDTHSVTLLVEEFFRDTESRSCTEQQ